MNKTVIELDLVGYSTICDNLEQGLDVNSVLHLNQQIQAFIDAGLQAINVTRDQTVMFTTGDGAILVFDSAKDAHLFAEAAHAATREHNRKRKRPLAKRVFRSGAATGEIVMQPKPSGGFEIAGTVIARSVRLEAKADPGSLLIDEATYSGLSADQRKRYGPRATVPSKRDEIFEAYSCQLNSDGPKDAEYFTRLAKGEFSSGVMFEIGYGQRREVVTRLKHVRSHQYSELLFLLEVPIGQRPPDALNLDTKKNQMLQWAEENNRLTVLLEVLRELTQPLAGCEMDAEVAARLVSEANNPGRKEAIVGSIISELPAREDPTERYWLYIVLGQIGGKAAAAAVGRGLSDPNEFARQGANEAMAALRTQASSSSPSDRFHAQPRTPSVQPAGDEDSPPTMKERMPMTSSAKRRPRVFISHSSKDNDFVRKLVTDLKRRELNVWLDEQELKTGDSIVEGIEGGLRDTDYLVVVLSKASVESRWVQIELDTALLDQLSGGGTVILPLVIEDCEIPTLLKTKIYADFRKTYEQGLAGLLAGIDNEARLFRDFMDPPSKPPQRDATPDGHDCSVILGKLTIGDLRRRLNHRLDRREVSDAWFDTFDGEQMHDHMANSPKNDCVRILLDRARKRQAFPALLAHLCSNRPDLVNP